MNCLGPTAFKGKCVRGRNAEVIDCVPCGFKHLHPKPGAEELAEYYKEEYFGEEKPDYSAEHDAIDEYWQLVYQEQFLALREVGIFANPMYDLLDVGCGREPVFLRYALEHKRAVPARSWGMDPSLEERTDLISTSWEEADQDSPSWGLINLGFVLEHAANPCEILYNCRLRMKKDGFLLVEVPFDFNPMQESRQNLGAAWWVSSPDHLNYFTPETLEKLLIRCGLYPRIVRTTYPVELFKLHGADYSTDEGARERLNAQRARLQDFWWNSGMSQQTKIGRTVWVIAQRS